MFASMLIDDMLKDDGGAEAAQLMYGEGFKRKPSNKKNIEMGAVASRIAIGQLAKQAAIVVTKQAVKQIAKRGAKELAKGAALGIDVDAAMKWGRKRRRRRKRKTIRRKPIKKEETTKNLITSNMARGEGLNLFQQPSYDNSILSRTDTEYLPPDIALDNN